ncbi:MAG: KpsF/GutQ family sugar-phosphate isomerase [Gemmatimonadales bacterium]
MSPDAVAVGRRVLALEAGAIEAAAGRLDRSFARAVETLAGADRVIVSGVGKSGLVARKIAATLTSTGTPASFLHPTDSLHGDLGPVAPRDAAIVLSKSGETEELFGLLSILARRGVPVIAVTGAPDSTVGRAAAVVLHGGVSEEACPHDLAPTASTTVALALGDALAVALLEHKGFSREAFAELHPGGALGRKLLLRVRDLMVPLRDLLAPGDTMRKAVVHLAHQRGMAIVAVGDRLEGVITAGDLSRLAERGEDYLALPVDGVMTRDPKTVAHDELAAHAVGLMERHGIMVLPVLDGDRLVGAVHLHDLLRGGAV